MKTFDVVIIGGGPGGMTAGVLLSKAGKSVALVQQEQDSFGGICLNRGCMPTKSLLKAAAVYRNVKEGEKYGLEVAVQPVNLERLLEVTSKDRTILSGMTGMMVNEADITTFRGMGSFQSAREIVINSNDGSSEVIQGEFIIIATGAAPYELPLAPFDGQHILSSDQILQNADLPPKLLIIGGGAIGCEFATLYNTFGSRVTVVEAMDSLMPREDLEAGKRLEEAFTQQGIRVKTNTVIEAVTVNNGMVEVRYKGSDQIDIVDKVLVGVGRKPNIETLNLSNAGVEVEKGAIKTNEFMQTTVSHIFCVGDASGGVMLAHAAEKEGELLAINLSQGIRHGVHEAGIPRVTFSHPEVASVGISQKEDGIRTFTMDQIPNGRTVVDKVIPAFVKLFIREESNEIAGAVIIGESATELIHEMALAVENRITLEQVGKTVHGHPTHSTNVVMAVHHAG